MIKPLHLTVALWLIRCCFSMSDSTQFLHIVEELVLKFSSLVMMNSLRESKPHDEIIEQLISSRFGRLVMRSVCLGKSCVVVHDHKYILASTRAWF